MHALLRFSVFLMIREQKRVCLLYFSLQGEKDRNIGFVYMGVGERREKRVFIMISVSTERRIETMDSFVWEMGGQEKRVCLL